MILKLTWGRSYKTKVINISLLCGINNSHCIICLGDVSTQKLVMVFLPNYINVMTSLLCTGLYILSHFHNNVPMKVILLAKTHTFGKNRAFYAFLAVFPCLPAVFQRYWGPRKWQSPNMEEGAGSLIHFMEKNPQQIWNTMLGYYMSKK